MPTLVHSKPETIDLSPQVPALHEFMMRHLCDVERICPVAFDYLQNAITFLGAPHGLSAEVEACDISAPKSDPADIATYYAYCIEELEAIDLHVALLTKIAVAILSGHANQNVEDLVNDLLFKDLNRLKSA